MSTEVTYDPDILQAVYNEVASWPEVLRIEGGYPDKSIVQFYPLRMKYFAYDSHGDIEERIQYTEPVIFEIDHTAPADGTLEAAKDPRGGIFVGCPNHWTPGIRALTYGHRHACRWEDPLWGRNIPNGQVCRGTEFFDPGDPLSVFARLHSWYINSVRDEVASRDTIEWAKQWWQDHGDEFFATHKQPVYINPQTGQTHRLTRKMVTAKGETDGQKARSTRP